AAARWKRSPERSRTCSPHRPAAASTSAARTRWMSAASSRRRRCARSATERRWRATFTTETTATSGPIALSIKWSTRLGRPAMTDAEALLAVRNVTKAFAIRGALFKTRIGEMRAVDDVSLTIPAGTSYGLVGESGSGKTTLGKVILRLVEPTTGQILFEGKDLCQLTGDELQLQRAGMQMVFQNPYSSLDPRQSVKSTVAEPLVIFGRARGQELDDRVRSLIATVGLRDEHLYRFPHEFSGGQRSRSSSPGPSIRILGACCRPSRSRTPIIGSSRLRLTARSDGWRLTIAAAASRRGARL